MPPSSGQITALNPNEAFAAFHRRVVADGDLFGRLQNTPSLDAFIARAIDLGGELGLIFGPDEVRAALQNARRAWLERRLA
jgi:hypothetical protein